MSFIAAAFKAGGDGAVTDDVPGRTRPGAGRATGGSPASRAGTRSVRALRAALSLGAVLGLVLVLGVAAGALAFAVEALLVPADEAVERLLLAGLLAVPAATVLFVALYDGAALVRPAWPGPHPPLADAWLLPVAAVGGLTLAFSTPAWPELARLAGVALPAAAAYLAVPFWLARRCLRRPSWMLGGVAVLAAPLVVAVGGLARSGEWVHGGDPLPALVVAAAGIAVPYGLADASPGPDALAGRFAAGLRRAGALLGAVTVQRGDE